MKMIHETTLKIIDYSDGLWKFDIKAGMSDDEIRKLLGRMEYVENILKALMKTELIKVTDTIEILRDKKGKILDKTVS